jgi:hypothetical protein
MRRLAKLGGVALLVVSACGPTEAGESVGFNTEIEQEQFFTHDDIYFVRIEGWDSSRMTPDRLANETTHTGAKLLIYRSEAGSPNHCPDGEGELLYKTDQFSIRTSGNFTNGTPKSSYKLKLDGERFAKMKTLNLKSMWNDVSQMREALAWEIFDEANVPSSRHAYARFCINDRYYGLYSLIEQVDKPMLKGHFDDLDEGNLYKAYWDSADLGPADLTHRTRNGSDTGRAYYKVNDIEHRTYQLKSNEDDPALASYDDLATFVRVLNGKNLAGAPLNSETYRKQLEAVFDVKGFLRWAGVNNLLGAWDNYWGTPANYYIYNGGHEGSPFMDKPYFTWIPWDYDNSFGIDFFDIHWEQVGIVDWSKHTRTPSRALPLVTNLLQNDVYLAYYLDHMECVIDKYFNPDWIAKQIGDDNRGLWGLIKTSAFLESDTPTGAPHTGRQFTNDQVYWNGFKHQQLEHGSAFILGIWHHVNARKDSALSQIEHWRSERNLPTPAQPVCE